MTEKRGKWITVRPCDRRVKSGSRVRLAGVEGHAYLLDGGAVQTLRAGCISWMARDVDIELWVEEEVLPLPEPGIPFWGEVNGQETWLIESEYGEPTYSVWSATLQDCFRPDQVTRLPIPPEEMEKLK